MDTSRIFLLVAPLAVAGLLTLSPSASAQEGKGITLDELLSTVAESHPLFIRERAAVAMAAAAEEEAAGGEEWTATVEGYTTRDESPRSQPLYPDRVDRQGVHASLTRPVWATGGALSLAYQYARTDQQVAGATIPMSPGQPPFVMPGDTAIYYQGGATLTYVQPLWQDRGGKASRLAADMARFDTDATRVESAERQEDLLAELVDRYLTWVYLHEGERIAVARHDLARRDRDRVRQMRRSNLVDAVDLIRADDAVLATGQGVAAMRATRRAAAEELARLSGVDRLAHDTPGFDLYAVPPTPSPDEGGEAIKQGRQVTRLDTRIVQAGRGVEGAETVVDPRLDLILAGTSEGAGEAADDGFSSTAADYTAALRFTWQLGSRSAKAAHQKAIMERNRLVALRDETIRSLDGAVRGIAVRLAGLEEVRAVDQNRIAAAEKRATAELERYRQGRSDYTYVIAAQDLVQQARLQYAADALLSQSLAYRYAALTDRLLAEGE